MINNITIRNNYGIRFLRYSFDIILLKDFFAMISQYCCNICTISNERCPLAQYIMAR